MKRERPGGGAVSDRFFQRLAKRYGLSEMDISRLRELQLNGTPRAEIFRLASSGRSDSDGSHWSGIYKEGKLKAGRPRRQ